MNISVLLIIFNRKDTVEKILPQIRKAAPERLYIACDAPRNNVEGEAEKVLAVREYVLSQIDWNCKVTTNFLTENQGAKNIHRFITWFFENEKEGIILEDDCIPNDSFFNYCSELLEKYRDDKRVWNISGYNPLNAIPSFYSYFFHYEAWAWGWATWADRWLPNYKFLIDDSYDNIFDGFTNIPEVVYYYKQILSEFRYNENVSTWDVQWNLAIIKNKGACILPTQNLVSNIGVGGLHFDCKQNPYLCTPTYEIKELRHPEYIDFNAYFIYYLQKNIVETSYVKEIIKKSYLFDILPILKIVITDKASFCYLFGFIPFLKFKSQKSDSSFKLNFCKIPILKTITKKVLY